MNKIILNFEGVDGIVEVSEDRIQIKAKGIFQLIGNQGNETIFIKDINSVEVRECSFFNSGHIQFSTPGSREQSNKIIFGGFGDRDNMNENANKVKAFILKQMQILKSTSQTVNQFSVSDELLKLSKLKQDGILSEEEFQSEKKKLLK